MSVGPQLGRTTPRAALYLTCCAALAGAGCFTDAEGREPDPSELYFPTALVVSPGRNTLYVANSDFDLRYSGGHVQTLDLVLLRSWVGGIPRALADGQDAATACASVGLGLNPDPWSSPGPCSPFGVAPLIRTFAFIGAFASGALLVHRPDAPGARLFVPVRGDPSITYFDVDDDRDPGFTPSYSLYCAKGSDGFCAAHHRVGRDPDQTLRDIQLPADPVGIAATADGVAVVSAHQTKKSASLVINDWNTTPWLSYFTSNLPVGPTELAAIPEPAMVAVARAEAEQAGRTFSYQPGFVLTFRSTSELDILRYHSDSGASPPRPFVVRASAHAITTNSEGFDSRGVAVRANKRQACEAACGDAPQLACLQACAENVPIELFVANRTPPSLLVGEVYSIVNTKTEIVPGQPEPQTVLSGAVESLFVYDTVPLTFGPSRLEMGHVVNSDGELEQRVFIVCFDSRVVFCYDPNEHRVESVIHTGRGPHDIAFDTGDDGNGNPYSYLYVGHFTDSYIGVVDLDMRHPLTYAQMFASIGVPTPPTETN